MRPDERGDGLASQAHHHPGCPMLTADERAALVERLRDDALARERGWRDLEAAADELSRPRPRVEWLGDAEVGFSARIVGMSQALHRGPLSRSTAASYADDLRAAGFDVAEVPR